jgi:1-acyl-sn-glycerol-3-phosphate acyltransferase
VRTEREPSLLQQIERLAVEVVPELRGRASPDVPLAELGLDSLGFADLSLAVEQRFGVRLGDGDPHELRTIADIADVVAAHPEGRRLLPKGIGRSVDASKAIAGPALRRWLHMRVTGVEHVPATGPVIVAANHRSMWDIPVLVVACPRRIVFMAKSELYRNPVLRRLWFELGGFPVRRDVADLHAVDDALAVLERGLALGLYPEGTRSFTGEMLPFLEGAAWLALNTGTPIVPCGISGTSRRTRGDEPRTGARRPVSVAFGPPILVDREPDPLARRAAAGAITDRLLKEIDALLA